MEARWRRRLRRGQKQVDALGVQAEQQLEKLFFGRFERLRPVRRFIAGWTGLVLLLIAGLVIQNISLSNYYQTLQTVPGGIYNEGVRGRFTNANPLYASSEADNTVSHLLFAGLFTVDSRGDITPDLAKSYGVDSKGTTYTVHLKPHLTWHDGQPLTSADVAFTYHAIQNPDAQSPLLASWQGITVTAPDSLTVVFKLPGGLASFAYNLTNGIVPQHLLAKIPAGDLRSADFNTVRPVGSGPFMLQTIQVSGDGNPQTAREQIALVPFKHYQAGQPKLQKFVVQVFADEKQLITALADDRLTAVEGLNQLPSRLRNQRDINQHSLTLRAANMVFFKTSAGVLADQAVRSAMVESADVPSIIKKLGYPTRQVREPLLTGQLAYDSSAVQAGYNMQAAAAQLDAAGWKITNKLVRVNAAGKPLAFGLTVSDTPENHTVANQLISNWKAIGVAVTPHYLAAADFQSAASYHDYDAILDGISIGVDPDVFVYWDSSQADIRSANRLNLSEYKSTTADSALEAGRTRLDPSLRVIKYKPFLQAWQHDAPALALYQPRLLYLTNGLVNGLQDQPINASTDRFANVQNWEIRQAKVTH